MLFVITRTTGGLESQSVSFPLRDTLEIGT